MGTFTFLTKRGFLLITAMLLFSGLFAQISLTATGGTLSQTYTTLGAAFTAINAGTHTGTITIDITANCSETGPCVLNSSGAGSASYTSITIQPAADGLTISGATATGRGLIELNGADNVTINGDNPNTGGTNRNLTITNTAANTVTFTMAIRVALSTLISSSDNVTIKNCIVNGSATGRDISSASTTSGTENNTYGIYVGGNASTAAATTAPSAIASLTTTLGAGPTANSFTVDNCLINACAKGIAFMGSVVSNSNSLTFTNNTIGDATAGNATTVYTQGISAQGFTAAVIRGNTFRNIESWVGSSTGSNIVAAIALGNISSVGTGAVIEKNSISHIHCKNTGTWPSAGIYLSLSTSSNSRVANNFISDINRDMSGGTGFGTALNCSGIKINGGTNYTIYNNSVQMFGSFLGTSANNLSSACLSIGATGQTGVDVRNNIFSNTMTGGGTSIAHVCVLLPSGGTSAMNYTENNNAYYCGSAANQGVAHAGSTYTAAGLYSAANFNPAATTPATNFRSYSSTLSAAGTNDNASFAATTAAPFTSTTNLHINSGASGVAALNSTAVTLAAVTDDYDGDARIGPDMGADEFVYAVFPIDLTTLALVAPTTSGCKSATETVTVTIKNNGSSLLDFSVNNATVSVTATGGYSSNKVINTGTLAVGASLNVTMPATANLSAAGSFTFNASVSVTGDGNSTNDAMSPVVINSLGSITVTSALPYVQDFESGQGGWASGGTSNSWAFGTANKATIKNSTAPATVGTNVWTTGGLTGSYNSSEQSFVTSPCFDLSALNPAASEIVATIWWNSEAKWDGAQLQYSTDGGTTWTNIGVNGDPNNWYNSATMSASAVSTFFGGNTNWWSGRAGGVTLGSGGWVTAKHDLPAGAIISGVRFRFAFASDGSGVDDGIAFDNVIIHEKLLTDVGAATLATPAATGCYGNAETITVQVKNFGSGTIDFSTTPVTVTTNVTGAVTQTLTGSLSTGTLAPGATVNVPMSATLDMTTLGTYTFNASTSLTGDQDATNNAMPAATRNGGTVTVTSASPYSQNFEGGQGGWTSGGTSNSWAFGTANKTTIKNSALPATVGTNVWTTGGLTGSYNSNEASFVVSPCFNLGTLSPTASEILLTVWWSSEAGLDGAQLQYSIDGGATWVNIGVNGDPNNWYNSASMGATASAFFGGNTNWWSGRTGGTTLGSGGWLTAKHDLPAAAVVNGVKFRVGFASDGSVVDDGFAFDNVIIREKNTVDVGAAALTAPAGTACYSNAETVTVQVKNYGAGAINMASTPITVTTNVTGAVTQTLTGTLNTGTLASGATTTVTMSTTLDMTPVGVYTFNSSATVTGDQDATNNAMPVATRSGGTITVTPSTPYTQNFESGQGGWASGGSNNSWAFGTANKTTIKNSANPSVVGANVWTTGGLTGSYNNTEASFVSSPCFNLASLNPSAAEIVLTLWWSSEAGLDGAQLQYSTNGGGTWTNIGVSGDPNNWYNSSSMGSTASTFFGGNTNWWSGRTGGTTLGSGAWVLAKHDLPAAAVANGVKFRVAFASDGSAVDDGVAFDNIIIHEKLANDVGVAALNSPVPASSICGGTTQAVTVTLANYGYVAQSNIPVTVNVTGPVTQTLNAVYAGPLAPFTVANFTVGSLNMSAGGTYVFNSSTSLAGDQASGNDAMPTASVNTINPVVNVVATPQPACAGQPLTLSATVTGTPAGSATFAYTTPQSIPDRSGSVAGVLSSTIAVGASSIVSTPADLKVTLNFGTTASSPNKEHTWMGDLIVTLTSPGGTTVVFDRMGVPVSSIGDGDDFNGAYTFATTASTILPTTTGSMATGGNVNNGTYLPSNEADVAHNWTGLSFPFAALGNWTLTVRDTGAGDVGDLVGWSINIPGNYTHAFSGPGSISSVTYSGTFNATGEVTVNGLSAGTPSFSVLTTDPAGCSSTKSINPTVTVCTNTWEGDVVGDATNWFNPGNWSLNFVPNTCGANVVIPTSPVGGVFPVINATSPSVGNVNIDDNATITINAGKTLSLCGNWVGGSSSASQILGAGTVVLAATAPQQLSGKTEFQNLQLNNPTGATLQAGSRFDIFGEVALQTGTLTTGSGLLIFRSTSDSQIGIIDNFSAGYTGTISGGIQAERYYHSSTTYDAHYMGSPVDAATLSSFAAGGTTGYAIPTASCDETQLQSGSPYGAVASMDESVGAGCAMKTWKFENTAAAAQTAKGYSVRKTGSGVITVSGNPNLNSSYALNSLNNSGWAINTSLQGRPMGPGWHMVANPFLANLDISSTPAGFDATKLVWINDGGGSSGTYQPATIVAPFQAFMVHRTTGGTANYTINASQRTKNAASYSFQKQGNDHELSLTAINNGTQRTDVTKVAFNTGATMDHDADFDCIKIAGALDRHTLYTYNSDPLRWMAINTLKSIEETSTVNVGFEPGINGSYTFHFDGMNSFDPTSYVTLEDKLLNVFHDVRSGDYSFTSNATDNWNRFVLHFTPAAKFNTSDASCSAAGQINIEQPGTANWNYVVSNSNNVTISSGNLNNSNPVTVSVPTGTYTVTLTDNNNYTVVKNVLVSGASALNAAMNVSKVTAEEGEDIEFTNATTNAASTVWEFGDGSSAASSNATHSYAQAGVYTVKLTVSNIGGCISTTQQTVTVTAKTATGIKDLTDGKIAIWSHANMVYVDFSKAKNVEATIDIYNILGQVVSSETFGKTSIYSRQLNNLDAGYVIVSVKNADGTLTKKVFISNNK